MNAHTPTQAPTSRNLLLGAIDQLEVIHSLLDAVHMMASHSEIEEYQQAAFYNFATQIQGEVKEVSALINEHVRREKQHERLC